MKMKKIISAICALSMAVTSFAAMALTAKAEGETTLWSDTFNGYDNVVEHYNQQATLGSVLVDGTLTAGALYEGIEGVTLTTTNRADDSAWFKITTGDDGNKYLTTMTSRFSSSGRGGSIGFKTLYSAAEGADVVLAFKVMYNNTAGTTYDSGFLVGTTFVDLAAAGVEQDTWTDVKVVVKTTGSAVYIGDSTTPVVSGMDTGISSIKFDGYSAGASWTGDAQRSATHPTGYPTFNIDDMVVYNAADGLNSTVPEAEDKGVGEITYANAPKGTVPEGMNVYADLNFDNETPARLTFVNDGLTDGYTAIDSITLKVGQDGGDTRSETKWETIGNKKSDPEYGTDIYLQAVNSTGSTANRGPQLTINKTVDERETVGVQFATRLHAGASGPAEVIFSGDLVASASKGNLASPLAMITTDATAESGVYACDNPLVKVADGGTNVLQVADDEWVLVTINATRPASKTVNASIAVTTGIGTENEATTYILGSAEEMVTIQDSTRSGVTTLPYITFRSGNDTDYGVSGSTNDIDNILVYTDGDASKPEVPDSTLTDVTVSADGLTVSSPTEASATAVVIKATPKADGTFAVEIVKGLELGDNTITWTNAPVAGDKIMVFNGFKSLSPAALIPVVIEVAAETPAE